MNTILRAAMTLAMTATMALASAAKSHAEDAFYNVRWNDIAPTQVEAREKPEAVRPDRFRGGWFARETAMQPYVVLDGPGEGYLANVDRTTVVRVDAKETMTLAVRAPEGKDVSGRLYFINVDHSGMDIFKFVVTADSIKSAGQQAKADAKDDFHRAKTAHFDDLRFRNLPGSAWFRHEADAARAALGLRARDADRPEALWGARREPMRDSYDLWSGGRAVSENLQLDRALLLGPGAVDAPDVEVASIKGITVSPIDWSKLTSDLKPTLDPLAKAIPADQHVVFFPNFSSFVRVADEADRYGTPVLQVIEQHGEDMSTVKRYERQLCLSLTGVGRIVGPQVVKSVALTGSDWNFTTGTDVAIVFEADNPDALVQLLMAQVRLVGATYPGAKPVEGQAVGLAYRGMRSADRVVSSYVTTLPGAVVVTNSPYQLERLAAVREGKTQSIAALPEFTFFRDRYRVGDKEETALIFLSDATIRRWCDPRWRIANSRRTRDAAVMAEIQAAHVEELINKQIKPGPVSTDLPLSAGGKLELTASGVVSSVHGPLALMSPLSEIPLSKVTGPEARAYELWRDGYERNWTWKFDPIALRVGIHDGRLSADLSVMPLILGTQYREILLFTQGAKIAPAAGDPHADLFHFTLAINKDAPGMRWVSGMSRQMAPQIQVDPLGWVGDSVTFFVDSDPIWEELIKQSADESQALDTLIQKNLGKLPFAVRIESASAFKLAAFLTGFRAYVDQSAPGLTIWETLKHNEQPYVKVSATEPAGGGERRTVALYYAATPEALVITPNEPLLKRALDRQQARAKATPAETTVANKPHRLGENLAVHVESALTNMLVDGFFGARDQQSAMQLAAWNNIPILNEWHRMFPERDPVAIHERVWNTRLICPGRGKYVWNDEYQTMESTVFGHPGRPKAGPTLAGAFQAYRTADFGLTFEHDGLRARVELVTGDAVPKK